MTIALFSAFLVTDSVAAAPDDRIATPGEIPEMFEDEHITSSYLGFLHNMFPDGIPKETVPIERQHFLYRYCIALFERRIYQETLDCLSAVDRAVTINGDPEPNWHRFLWTTVGVDRNGVGGEFPLTTRLNGLRAEVFYELGDFTRSAYFADKYFNSSGLNKVLASNTRVGEFMVAPSISLNREVPETVKFGYKDYGLSDMIHRLSILAIAYDRINEKSKTELIVRQLERFHTASMIELAVKTRIGAAKSGLARLFMATGRHNEVISLLDATRSKDDDTAQAIVASVIGLAFLPFAPSAGLQSAVYSSVWASTDSYNLVSKFQVSHAQIELGRFNAARLRLSEILKFEQIKKLSGIYWAVLYDNGRVAESDGNLVDAIAYYRSSIDEIERQRSTINTDGAKIGFFGDKQAVYQALVRLLFQTGKQEEAFLIGERSKSRALVDMLANKQDFHIANADAEKINHLLSQSQVGEIALARNTTADTDLANRLSKRSMGKDGAGQVDVSIVLEEVRNLKVSAKDQLTAQAPQLASLISVPQVNLADIQQKLPADQAILSYYYDAENLYAFVIDSKKLKATRLARKGLEDDIQTFRQAIATRDEGYRQAAQSLYKRLIAPLAGQLHYPKILIAGHGTLHYLPFGALTDGTDFLLDRYEISVLPSASTLKFVGNVKASDKPGTVLAFGNPDLGDKQFNLDFAEKEAKEVAGLFDKSALFLGKEASKKNFKEYGQGFQYLHFATHGKFDPAHPLDSALMLSTKSVANTQDQLTIGELYSMRIDAELVTLSACETGLGKVANGDDVVGLVRGFLYAGANQIVSTLWEIDDVATSTLMAGFYTNIKAGMSSTAALRRSQQSVRQQYSNPFFWAAFQITGGAG